MEGELARLGNTPLGRETLKSIDQMTTAMKAVTDAQQKLADRAVAAARGLELVGGASKLTATEMAQVNRTVERGIEAFRAMGKDVPPSLQRIADEASKVEKVHGTLGNTLKTVAIGFAAMFTARAAVNFVGDVLREASALKDLSQQTHINVEELQLLAAAVSEFGVDADTLGKGLFTLSRKISGGDDSVSAALATMGLSLKDVQGLNGEALFLAIERGLATLQGSLRDETAATLFGSRLGMSMAGASEGIDAALEKARRLNTVLSKESIDAMDEYDESIKRAQRSLSAMAGNMIGPVAQGFNVLNDAAIKGASKWDIFVAVFKDFTNSGLRVGANTQALAKVLDDLNKKTEVARVVTAAFVGPINAVAAAHERSAPKVTAHGEATKAFAAVIAKTTPLLVGASLSFKKYSEDVSQLAAVIPDLSEHLATMADRFADVRANMDNLVASDIVPMFSKLPDVVAQSTKAIAAAGEEVERVTSGIEELADSFARLAQISGDSFDGIVKDIARVVGAMALGSKAADEWNAASDDNDGERDWGKSAVAVVGMVGAMDEATKSSSRMKAALGGAATGMKIGAAVAGPYGAAIGAAAGALIGLFRAAGASERAINPVREAIVQAAGGFDAFVKKVAAAGASATAFFSAKNDNQLKKAMDDLNAAFQIQVTSTAALEAAIQKYGFSIEELGPALQRQELGKQAESIFRDWTILNSAGIDTVAIAGRMAESINTYVQQAVAMGVEVPAAMKPMLQSMIDQGLLTDAAGNKIEKMEDLGVVFAQTMTEGFKSVVDEVKKLAEAISGKLGTAIANIPTSINIPVNLNAEWHIPNRPEMDFVASGGLVTSHGMQHFASGGTVLPFRRRGSDSVPAMLTPGEIILNEAQQKHVAGAMSGVQRGSPDVVAAVAALTQRMDANERALPKRLRDFALILKASA